MLSRSRRLFGIVALALAAATVTGPTAAHADDDLESAAFLDEYFEATAYADELIEKAEREGKRGGISLRAKPTSSSGYHDIQLPRELQMPLCLPSHGIGLPLVGELLPKLTGC